MRTTVYLPCLLACALAGCASEPGESTTNDDTSGTGGDSTGAIASTGTTGDAPTTGGPTDTGAPTGETGDTSGSTGATGDDTGTTGATGDTTGSSSGGDDSTGSTGAIGSTSDTDDTSTSDTGDSSGTTGEPGGLGQDAQDVVAALEAATEGVLYTSESDYPWVVVAFADAAPVTEANVKDVIVGVYVPHDFGPSLEERAIEVRTLAQLMDPLTVPKDWWDPEYFEQAEKYQPIRDIFEMQLTNVQVFRLGELTGNDLTGAIDVYVLGETADGDVVGMWSVSVET